MRKITKGVLAGALAVGAVLGGASAAMASTQINYTMYSPGNYGHTTGSIIWDANQVTVTGYTHDDESDGHGPYTHIIDASGYQLVADHVTTGTGGEDNYFNSNSGSAAAFVDVWICNGGTSAGYGVEGGCYGRRAYNQILNPGKGSLSLGTTTGLVY